MANLPGWDDVFNAFRDKQTRTKWEREHTDEAIEAIKAGYDWTKTKSCWSVTHRNNRNEALAEVSTRLVAVKIAVRLWQDDIRPA